MMKGGDSVTNASTSNIVFNSFSDYWHSFGSFLPSLLVAIILIAIGFVVAWALELITFKILRGVRIDQVSEKLGISGFFEKSGVKFRLSKLLSRVIYWFIIIVFLSSAAEVLGLSQIQDFLASLVGYLPNVIAALAILVIGLLVASSLSELVRNVTVAPDVKSSHFLAKLTRWSIVTFSVIAALVQLEVAPRLLEMLFGGLVVMLALAGGLAFGLGGKDAAKDTLERWRSRY